MKTETPKHTPIALPLRVETEIGCIGAIVDANNSVVLQVQTVVADQLSHVQRRKRAEFIVRSVNLHAELVARADAAEDAVLKLLGVFDNISKRNPGYIGKLFGIDLAAMNEAFIAGENVSRAVLARAKEGTD